MGEPGGSAGTRTFRSQSASRVNPTRSPNFRTPFLARTSCLPSPSYHHACFTLSWKPLVFPLPMVFLLLLLPHSPPPYTHSSLVSNHLPDTPHKFVSFSIALQTSNAKDLQPSLHGSSAWRAPCYPTTLLQLSPLPCLPPLSLQK